jgi:hypothetical protein
VQEGGASSTGLSRKGKRRTSSASSALAASGSLPRLGLAQLWLDLDSDISESIVYELTTRAFITWLVLLARDSSTGFPAHIYPSPLSSPPHCCPPRSRHHCLRPMAGDFVSLLSRHVPHSFFALMLHHSPLSVPSLPPLPSQHS